MKKILFLSLLIFLFLIGMGNAAVEYISSEFVTETASTGSNTITVPSDCTLLVVTFGYDGGTNATMTAATLNSVALTKIVDALAGVNNPAGGVWVLANPATGSQSLATTFSSDRDTHSVFAHYFKGVNTTTPVRDNGLITGTGTTVLETTSFDVVAGDLALVVASGYANTETIDAAPTGKGQTGIYSWSTTKTKQNALATKAITETGTTTVWGGACDFNAVFGVSLIPASLLQKTNGHAAPAKINGIAGSSIKN